jgi:hypothetical protein
LRAISVGLEQQTFGVSYRTASHQRRENSKVPRLVIGRPENKFN